MSEKLKIAVTGDLHYGNTSAISIQKIAKAIRKTNPDIIAIIGDVAEVRSDFDKFESCLKFVKTANPEIPVLVIPGNHDLWVGDQNWNSVDLFERLLPDATARANCHWLENKNFVLNGVAIVGSYLHYDYSAKDTVGPCSVMPDEWFEYNKGTFINDRFMKGHGRDAEFSQKIGAEFKKRLQAAQDDDAVSSIVVVTHVPCMELQIRRNPHDYDWAKLTPFFGILTYEDFIKSLSKVRFVVSGHSHQKARATISEGGRTIEIYNLDSDYKKPKFIVLDV